MTVELGSTLLGVGGLLTALLAIVQARKARNVAAHAMALSPSAQFEGLREQIKALGESYKSMLSRNQMEREGMERALSKLRERAEGAERENFDLRSQVVATSVGLVEATNQIAELRQRIERFEAPLNQ